MKMSTVSHSILFMLVMMMAAQAGHAQQKNADRQAFELKQKENRKLFQQRMHRDSLARVKDEQRRADSLGVQGITAPPAQAARMQSASVVTVMSAADLNLGFEDGLTGWSGELSYNLKKAFGNFGDIRRSVNVLDETGVVNYPETSTTFPSGIPSLVDTKPYALGGPVINQPPRHAILTDKSSYDYYGGFPVIPSFAENKVVRLGNSTVGYFKDAGPNTLYPALYEWESMSYTFTVPEDGPYIVVNYAVVLADPSATGVIAHSGDNKTFFKITVQKEDNSFIDCATYEVFASSPEESRIPGFVQSDKFWEYQDPTDLKKQILYKPWATTVVDLHEFVGQTVTLKYSTGDCLAGGHFAYAYIDAYATANAIKVTSNGQEATSYCRGELLEFSSPFTGRYDDEEYLWDFGDGSTSTAQNPTHVYTAAGSKTVTLNVTSSMIGGSCGISRTVTIDEKPDATFTIKDAACPTCLLSPNRTLIFSVTNHASGNNYNINWGDGGTTNNNTASITKTYTRSGTFTITNTATRTAGGCSDVKTMTVEVVYLCESTLPNLAAADGAFQMDRITGNIVYTRTGCPVQALMPCVLGVSTGNKVVKADATTFSDKWPYANLYADNSGVGFQTNADAFEKGERGRWRAKSAYAHNTSLIPEDKNFRSGTFTLQHFNWKNEAANSKAKWLLSTEVTAYSPNGDGLAEKNILGIESAAKFGYRNAVPYLTARNAGYTSVMFESFEMMYGSMLEDKMAKPTTGFLDDIRISDGQYAHSGYHSWRLPSGGQIDLAPLRLTTGQMSKGLQVKVWVRVPNQGSYNTLVNNATSQKFLLKIKGQSIAALPFKVLSRTGDWILCEANVTSFGTVQPGASLVLTMHYLTAETIWLDDVRVQPLDSEMSCYVYDKTNLRLMAVFDDQHFGLYYQYNGEGKLIRKMRETERGVKTIQETHYNTNLR